MKRKILLITNPGEVGSEHYDKGVYVDIENYKSYFMAPYGGYWSESEEILHLDKPTKSCVDKELLELSSCDFSIIIFCGHGYYSSCSDSNILELDLNERIDSLDLRKYADKRIIILDSCREVHPEYLTDNVIRKSQFFSESLTALRKLDSESCKRYYNKSIADCSEQLIVSYASGIGEVASGNSSKGGYYSSSLLKVARNWIDETIDSVDLASEFQSRSFPKFHQDSIPLVEKLSANKQNPQIDKPRLPSTSKYLPFAILA
jgi:hypothetical protein